MQNKPNFVRRRRISNALISRTCKMLHQNLQFCNFPKTKPNKANFCPNKANFCPNKANSNPILTLPATLSTAQLRQTRRLAKLPQKTGIFFLTAFTTAAILTQKRISASEEVRLRRSRVRSEFFVSICTCAVIALTANAPAYTTKTYNFNHADASSPVQDLNGLSAQATFTLLSATQLQIELSNTSTGLPAEWTSGANANQILTGVSFDMGHPGFDGDPQITGGTVVIGAASHSIDFDQITQQLGEFDDVSGEWGYGNMDGTGLLTNLVSAEKSQATRFPGANLDDGDGIDGPQGGLVALLDDQPLVDLGGLGAIGDSVIITLNLDTPLSDLDFLDENGVMVEFGSDKAFLVPEPATLTLLALGLRLLTSRRK
jgi:hypothetical protein